MGRHKAASKKVQVRFSLSEEEHEDLCHIADQLGCSVAEVLRRGIGPMRQAAIAHQAGVMNDLVLSGDPEVVAAKWKAIEARRNLYGWALCAKAAGVTYKTLKFWIAEDPVFRDLVEEAQAQGNDIAETWLVKKAKEGNVSAIFGILNAKHPDYGMIRTQVLNQILTPLLTRIIEAARRFLQPADLQRFAEEIGGHAERAALAAVTGKRR